MPSSAGLRDALGDRFDLGSLVAAAERLHSGRNRRGSLGSGVDAGFAGVGSVVLYAGRSFHSRSGIAAAGVAGAATDAGVGEGGAGERCGAVPGGQCDAGAEPVGARVARGDGRAWGVGWVVHLSLRERSTSGARRVRVLRAARTLTLAASRLDLSHKYGRGVRTRGFRPRPIPWLPRSRQHICSGRASIPPAPGGATSPADAAAPRQLRASAAAAPYTPGHGGSAARACS